jgi:hypothetical protein
VSRRVDRKLQDIAIAEYRYRHEGEFAAGFLEDAGIPYRLQIDDPAMGLTIATPTTLWVRGADERRAREVLDLEGSGSGVDDDPADPSGLAAGDPTEADRDPPLASGSEVRSGMIGPRAAPGVAGSPVKGSPVQGWRTEVVRRDPGGSVATARLTPLQRVLALVFSGGAASAAVLIDFGAAAPLWTGLLALVAAAMAFGGLVGRAIAPVRWLLRTLSGSAP